MSKISNTHGLELGSFSRRQFLKTSALAAGALALV
ncbi:MAG: twin-arginine translocation signal domain-containing protein, partial [Mesorhizobium sp.]